MVAIEHHRIRAPPYDRPQRVPCRCVYLPNSDGSSTSSTQSTTTTTTKNKPTPVVATAVEEAVDPEEEEQDPVEPKETHTDSLLSVLRTPNLYRSIPGSNAVPNGGYKFSFVSLEYPNGGKERYPLCIPKKDDEYAPLHDLKQTATIIATCCLTDRESAPFGDHTSGVRRSIVRACNRKECPELVEAVTKFNSLMTNVIHLRKLNNFHPSPDPSPTDLIYHILDQAYAHTVAPEVDSLKSYKGFSNNVYGEVGHTLVSEFIQRAEKIKPGCFGRDSLFVDMGSGTGNVVLQVAAETMCESVGIEVMENPSRLAFLQQDEFVSRCRMYNVRHGKTEILQGDFLNDSRVHPLLLRADVVFVNNYAFDAKLNFRILEQFLDLKEGCVVISLKPFGAGYDDTRRTENALESMFRVKEFYFGENRVSWMAEGGKYFVHWVERERS
ncbi:Nucleosomal histone H3-Lys79 methylase [Podochytrium sp. JEL0797]|nr:Nucleosomal histone H3-Lys79 methylase [Podochytrium sp. JEL0797]